jgi:hypothetical protein
LFARDNILRLAKLLALGLVSSAAIQLPAAPAHAVIPLSNITVPNDPGQAGAIVTGTRPSV